MITLPEEWFPFLTAAVIAAYLIFMIRGAHKGFLLQVLSLAATVLSFLGAWRYSSVISKYFNLWPERLNPFRSMFFGQAVQAWMNQMACFAVLLIGLRIVFALLEKLAQGISRIPVLKQVSQVLGGLVGAGSCTIWIVVIAMLLQTPLFSNGRQAVSSSAIGSVADAVSETSRDLGVPLDTAAAISKLYTDAKSLDDKDQKALEQWLDSHGFETLEEQEAEEKQ